MDIPDNILLNGRAVGWSENDDCVLVLCLFLLLGSLFLAKFSVLEEGRRVGEKDPYKIK